MKVPYNKSLLPLARELRKKSTLSEVLLWNILKQKRAMGFDFDRQKVIGQLYCRFLLCEIETGAGNRRYIT